MLPVLWDEETSKAGCLKPQSGCHSHMYWDVVWGVFFVY